VLMEMADRDREGWKEREATEDVNGRSRRHKESEHACPRRISHFFFSKGQQGKSTSV
jgi:hypothetical protein